MTLLIVVLLWVGTPIVVGIVQSITVDPRATYGPDFGVYVISGSLYGLYGVVGVVAGFVMLFTRKPMGAGLLAGTAVGLMLGFLTCGAVAEAVL